MTPIDPARLAAIRARVEQAHTPDDYGCTAKQDVRELLGEIARLRDVNSALNRRAQSAESDWQSAESALTALEGAIRAKVQELYEHGRFDHRTVEAFAVLVGPDPREIGEP